MNRPLRLLSSLAAMLVLAFAVTFAIVRAQPQSPRREELAAAAPAGGSGSLLALASGERAPAEDGDYDLSRLPVLSEVIRVVDRTYVDPRRIDPKAMVVAAMDGVERAVGEVMSEGDAGTGKLRVTVGTARQDFDISALKTIWDVRVLLGDVMGFVQRHLADRKNLRDVEYAAVNGMLSTLDPHTMLYDPRGYRDLRTTTRGEFGGLGFVISMRDGNLTVLRVLKNTPAQRAGIKAKDVITRIEDQSTINMDVQDAVDKLRGKPATRVNITVARAGADPRRLSLVREIINLETVPQAKLLEKQIGYVRVSQFAANTTRDLVGIVQQQRAQAGGTLRGLILDLRNNPGGLLDQAIQVSDLFLSEGVIVKTVGGDGSKVTEAHAERDDMTSLPLVVLVNNSSASASEIVAGALKNDNRALVIGRQTFGKGSVQVLHDFPAPGRPGDDLALKLTIAQYLTPGDVSIQEVGITPDVLLVPGRALKGAVNFFAPPRSYGEVDLERHLSNPTELALSPAEAMRRAGERAARAEKAPLELRYLLDEKEDTVAKALKADERREAAARAHADAEISPEQQEDEDVEANPDEVVEDFQIRFARDLLARHPYADRPRLLEAARLLVAEKRGEEESRLEQKLTQLGVDWSAAPGAEPGTPRAAVTVTPPPGKRTLAGETLPWTVTVENRGDAAFHRLRAWSSVRKNPLLDRREFVFGLVKPGEKRSWTVPVKLPKGMDSRHDEVALHFEDQGGKAPPDVAASVDVAEAQKPLFAFSTQVDDDQGGNGDGNVQRGEELTLRVDVRNEGDGASGDKTYVSLKSLGDDKVFIKKGRAVVGALKPGESRAAAVQLEVRRGLRGDVVPLRLMIHDEKLDEFVSEKVDLPVKAEGPSRTPARGSVRVAAAQALVRAGAAGDAPPLAVARKGAVMAVHGRFGESLRVEWQKGRFGFVAAADVAPTAARPSGTAAEVWQHEPPRIALEPDPQRGAPVVEGERLRVEGRAWVPDGPGRPHLRDVFVFVNDQKVYFRAAPTPSADRIDFAVDLPLKPGNNMVTVFAREDDEFQTHRSFVAYRRVPEVAAQGPR
jgi:carboxyl-terminal processing protease